jgi:uncharacterized protein (DUF927 family)
MTDNPEQLREKFEKAESVQIHPEARTPSATTGTTNGPAGPASSRALPGKQAAGARTGTRRSRASSTTAADATRLLDNFINDPPPDERGNHPRGLHWRIPDTKLYTYLCGPIQAIAKTRDEHGHNWGLLLQWHDRDGHLHKWAMPNRLLAGNSYDVIAQLLDRGLFVSSTPGARQKLMFFLSLIAPAANALSVAQTGWHNVRDQVVFVLPDEVFGAPADECVVLQTTQPVPHAFNIAGTTKDWRDQIGRYAIGNSRLILAIAMALAAPLVELVNEESGGLNFQGGSRLGKSTALAVAASVWGGGPHGYVRQWRSTANGLEGIAALHSGVLLCLDEMSQVDAREAGECAYLLANGAGKSRAGRDGLTRTPQTWRLLFLSTSEITLADKMQEAGKRARVGQEVRLVDVPADAGAGLGIFEKFARVR